MGRQRSLLLGLLALALWLATPPHSVAQVLPGWDFSVSGFGGGTIPFNTDIKASQGGLSATLNDVKLESSVSFGGKVGAWTTAFRRSTYGFDFGVEVDVTQFYPDIKQQIVSGSFGPFNLAGLPLQQADISSTIVGANLLVRYPFGISDRFPNGWGHYYIGIGGGAEIATLDSRVGSSTDTAPALQVLGGAKVLLTRNIGLFVEYKYTYASHSFKFNNAFGQETDKLSLGINHVVGGVAFHF